jgi:hypothetical protein
MSMKKPMRLLIPCFLFTLAACGSPEVGAAAQELKNAAKAAAGDAMAEAGFAAGGILTTQNACLLAGQSEAFCGCISTQLGNTLDERHLASLAPALKASLSGDVTSALKEASNIDPETRTALATCGTRAAIAGAIGQ